VEKARLLQVEGLVSEVQMVEGWETAACWFSAQVLAQAATAARFGWVLARQVLVVAGLFLFQLEVALAALVGLSRVLRVAALSTPVER
jgi:hypothetical protein